MPFRSEAQRKFLYANHPEIAKRWTEEAKRKENIQHLAKKILQKNNGRS